MPETKGHWDEVYARKSATEVSWYQRHPDVSLDLIARAGVSKAGGIIDVGGGASTMVDSLLEEGYQDLTVLDISASALDAARARLGQASDRVAWIEADITTVALPAARFDLWHDRAVFHFLTLEKDRARYVAAARHSVKAGGHVIVAAFGPDGPLRCSGLPVVRYDPGHLHLEFGPAFQLVEHRSEDHRTPTGVVQQFIYCYCRTI